MTDSRECPDKLSGIRIQPSVQIKKRNKGIMIGTTCFVSRQCYKRMKKPGCLDGICKRMKIVQMPEMDFKMPKFEPRFLSEPNQFDYMTKFYGNPAWFK